MQRWQKVGLGLLLATVSWAQQSAAVEQPDAQRVRSQYSALIEHYPPSLATVLRLDPTLLGNKAYLAPYPALVGFLAAHPEIALNPSFYLGEPREERFDHRSSSQIFYQELTPFLAFGMAIGLVVWLIRTVIDYRRWNKLAKVQTDVHSRILDRFTANEELLAYIQSPAGSKFLESSPITLDAGPRHLAAPMGRILWSVQAGLVSLAGGIGLSLMGGRFARDAGTPLHVLGVVGIALGIGFVLSAGASFAISRKLGLIEPPRSE
jgi:hypothetical protein